jgi:hypothetical protein
MRHQGVRSVVGGCLLAVPLGLTAASLSAAAATPPPTAVALAGCMETSPPGSNPDPTDNVRVDVDAYNLPPSADGTTTFRTGPGSSFPMTVAYGTASGFTSVDVSGGPDHLTITVEYTGPDGNGDQVSAGTLAVFPVAQCATDDDTTMSVPPRGVTAPIVGMASTLDGHGYYMVGSDGRVYAYGDAALFTLSNSADDFIAPAAPIVGMALTPDGQGYWLVGADGGIFTFGDAGFFGSTGALRLNQPIVGMAATPDGGGYWLVAADGGVFAFGDAAFQGSMGGQRLNKPVVGMAADRATGGYWLVASDGGIFSFDAPFLGSTGALRLNKPIVGMEAASDGSGYRFVATDGGVFCFGQPFVGSTGNLKLNHPVSAITPGPTGYWLGAEDGGVFGFNVPFYGTPA